MKRIILTTILFVCGVTTLFAQTTEAPKTVQNQLQKEKEKLIQIARNQHEQNLKNAYAIIDKQFENGEISARKAAKLKQKTQTKSLRAYDKKFRTIQKQYQKRDEFFVKIEEREDIRQQISASQKMIDSVVTAEKQLLKKVILSIDNQVDNKEITENQAQELKLQAARKSSIAIEEKTKIYKEQKENLLSRDSLWIETERSKKNIYIGVGSRHLSQMRTQAKRTQSTGLYLAWAFHNLNSKQNFSNDAFRNWGSKSFEIGYQRNTRIFKNSNLLHLNYGLTFMIDKLKMREDTYFVNNNGIVTIEPFGKPTCVSKFKTNYLTLPVEIEFDFSPSYVCGDKMYHPIRQDFRFGLGAFVGVLTGNRQKVKYTNENGNISQHLDRSHFELNQWIYGVSAHLGYKRMVFYMKYTLTPLFRNNPIAEYPFSVGVRFGG